MGCEIPIFIKEQNVYTFLYLLYNYSLFHGFIEDMSFERICALHLLFV